MTDPVAPSDLKRQGRKFWVEVTQMFELSEVEVRLLRECCRTLDEIEDLRAALRSEGTTVPGQGGQLKIHPAVAGLRAHRLMLGRLLGQLALPDEAGKSIRTPQQARGAKAAQSRWQGHLRHADSLRGATGGTA